MKERGDKLTRECNRFKWSDELEKVVIDNYENKSVEDIAKMIGATKKQLTDKMSVMKTEGKIIEENKYRHKVIAKKRKIEEREERKRKAREVEKEQRIIELKKIAIAEKKAEKERYKKKYKKIIEEDKKYRDYGIGKMQLDIEFQKDKKYLIEIYSQGQHHKLKLRRKFECKVVQATHDHITFENKNKVRESFLRNDILLGEVRIKEIA